MLRFSTAGRDQELRYAQQLRTTELRVWDLVRQDGQHTWVWTTMASTVEALNGTLRSAKRQKKVTFDAELLMMPKDKDVQVVLLSTE
ncbi:BQ2448_6056 [Microbotryum intermedium]|uniref:BQ2448_6056 protein n=1 Tax=Microbotryum intermedium TaxID=269621 RepID=A0A238FR99_9BASI|nr:BQ2448_6056 [Microbotryum intermedium]